MKRWLKNRKNSRTVILAAAALILLTGSAAGRVLAYFTTYTTAAGGKTLDLNFTTTIPNEEVENGKKNITIENTGNYDCYVRVKVFAGSQCILTKGTDSSGNWTDEQSDGYYYWKNILPAKGTERSLTGSLIINIDAKNITSDSFNVIVVQECIPVPYDQNGNAIPYDEVNWSNAADVIKTIASPSEPQNSDNTGEVNP